MDKFEYESFSQFRDVVEDLQSCFIDEDAYSRAPALEEWRRASRLCRRLSLLCLELYGYATACRQYQTVSIRERLHVVSNETQGGEQEEDSEENAGQGFVEFTIEEIKQMPKKLQKLIIVNRKRCRLRTHKSGKNTFTYEIRFRADGYNVSASGKTIALAKANMLEKLRLAKPQEKKSKGNIIPTTFNSFAIYYFENFRKERVAAQTYRCDLSRYKTHLQPYFGEKPLKKITPSDCKAILKKVKDEGKGKTADDLYSLMNGTFNCAITHRVLDFNPLDTVLHIQHDREEGQALTPEEEEKLLAWLPTSDCMAEMALMLFCGLRPNEMEDKKNPPVIEGEFIKAVNSKRHFKDKNKIEFKYIPICERAKAFINENAVWKMSAKIARRRLKEILPEHTLKDLRTTFFTKCQIFGVAEPALKEFMGHSFGKLGNAYSDLIKFGDYLLKEGKKLNEW